MQPPEVACQGNIKIGHFKLFQTNDQCCCFLVKAVDYAYLFKVNILILQSERDNDLLMQKRQIIAPLMLSFSSPYSLLGDDVVTTFTVFHQT